MDATRDCFAYMDSLNQKYHLACCYKPRQIVNKKIKCILGVIIKNETKVNKTIRKNEKCF